MPIIPRPILLVNLVFVSISSIGYLFISIILSKNREESRIACSYLCQSNSYIPSAFRFTKFARLIEPKLHDSYGYRDCSPHGLVDVVVLLLPSSTDCTCLYYLGK